LASICENKSFSASFRLVDVEDVALDDVGLVESDDWLCAANSAFMVSGEICEYRPALTDEVAVRVVLLSLSIANGLVDAPCDEPVCCVEDVFELVSD
jgi:hypothetical protein